MNIFCYIRKIFSSKSANHSIFSIPMPHPNKNNRGEIPENFILSYKDSRRFKK